MKFCGRRDGAHALRLNKMDLLRLEKSLPRFSPISQSCLPSYLPAYIQILSSSSSSSLSLSQFSVCPIDSTPSFTITNVPPYPKKHNCCTAHHMLRQSKAQYLCQHVFMHWRNWGGGQEGQLPLQYFLYLRIDFIAT